MVVVVPLGISKSAWEAPCGRPFTCAVSMKKKRSYGKDDKKSNISSLKLSVGPFILEDIDMAIVPYLIRECSYPLSMLERRYYPMMCFSFSSLQFDVKKIKPTLENLGIRGVGSHDKGKKRRVRKRRRVILLPKRYVSQTLHTVSLIGLFCAKPKANSQ
eukprot:scaffold10619_cov41-Attheya_sp.AAC.1